MVDFMTYYFNYNVFCCALLVVKRIIKTYSALSP